MKAVLLLIGFVFASIHFAEAQQPKTIPRVGFLSRDLHPADSRAPSPRNLEAFRLGLRELGYIEGKNITIEYRYAEGRLERLPALAEELTRIKVDTIIADSIASTRAAKEVTTTIPIVIVSAADPVEAGLIASLARPGGNITGTTDYTAALIWKRLELLKDIVPKVSRFAFLNAENSIVAKPMFNEGRLAAQALGVELQLIEVKTPNPDLEGAFRVMSKERIGAVTTGSGQLNFSVHRKRILELVEKSRLPAIYPTEAWIDAGGLMYYGANDADLYRRTAIFVDKILRGANPANLPVEQPTKFDLVINLKAANQISLTIPHDVLARADRVIK